MAERVFAEPVESLEFMGEVEELVDEGARDLEEIQGVLERQIRQAIDHYEENIEPDQEKSTNYYHARPFGDEEDGRSKVVSTDGRDVVKAMMPSLMRIFFGPEDVVEFRPRRSDADEQARQATDLVNYVIREENEGYRIVQGWMKDGLIRDIGYVKWGVEERENVLESITMSGLSELEVAQAELDPRNEVEILGVAEGTGDGAEDLTLYDVRITRVQREDRVWLAGVPNEELVVSPDARNLDDAPLVAHVREMPASDLIQMGVDPDLVEEHKGATRRWHGEGVEDARRPHEGAHRRELSDEVDDSMQPVLFTEAYARIDVDGDGIGELRRFWCVGPSFEIANFDLADGLPGEPVDHIPVADISPDPEPHEHGGRGVVRDVWDVQRVKSQIMRETLNSLALSVSPDTEVVENRVNMSDVLNKEMGRVIRVSAPGMIREVKHSFVGGDTLPMLEYWDSVKEDRTGISKAASGLDADALQSSTQAAVAATVTAAHQQVELVARNFAEGGMRKMFRGLLRTIVQNVDREWVIRLRGEYVPMDPSGWDVDMDVEVNVALGTGMFEDRFQVLALILQEQKEQMQHGSPLVSWVEYRHTLGKLTEMGGFKDSSLFFKHWDQERQAEFEQLQAQQEPEPDPAMLLVQVETQKVLAAVEEARSKLELEREKMILEREKAMLLNDREREKIARTFAVQMLQAQNQAAQAEASGDLARDQATHKAILDLVQQDRAEMDLNLQVQQMEAEQRRELMRAIMEAEEMARGAEAQAEFAGEAPPPEDPGMMPGDPAEGMVL